MTDGLPYLIFENSSELFVHILVKLSTMDSEPDIQYPRQFTHPALPTSRLKTLYPMLNYITSVKSWSGPSFCGQSKGYRGGILYIQNIIGRC